MSERMQQEAVNTAAEALQLYTVEWNIAGYIKKKFDEQFYSGWHCAVGRDFGSNVTHELHHFIHFFIEDVAVLLWKCD
ncbi:hypothetical protein SprV_0200718200 [Sparganum proliferum]